MIAINTTPQKPSDAWKNFTFFTTAASIVVIGGLIFWADISPLLKVSLSVSTTWALSNAVSLTKLLRDKQEYDDWSKDSGEHQRSRSPKTESSAAA
jgi:hypothetical protein